MGLTIHYSVNFNGTKEQLALKLDEIRNKCRDLPFEEVGEVKINQITQDIIDIFDNLQNKYSYPHNMMENLSKRDKIMEKLGISTWQMIIYNSMIHNSLDEKVGEYKDPYLISLSLFPGEGCENSDLDFYQIRKNRFYFKRFCKTQYSENFVKDHLLVIKLMDMLKENGFEVTVYDEGGYWETRDIKILAENINMSTQLLMSVFEDLKTQYNGITIESNIEKSKNFIKVNEKNSQK